MTNYRYLLSLALAATSMLAADQPASTEMQKIDEQLSSLQSELKDLRRDAFNREMHAQTFMFDNWHEYADEIKANTTDEKKIAEVKAKIKALSDRKEALQSNTK